MTDRAARPAGWRGLLGWCLYDWANSAYSTVIGTFIFAVYYTTTIAPDPDSGAKSWSFAIGMAGLGVALLSPALGAVADLAGRRKPWLAFFTGLCILSTLALFWVRPGAGLGTLALVLVALGTIAFELAFVFYNAMLPDIAPPGKLGRISGWGWGLGYVGGLICLALCLFAVIGLGGDPWLPLADEAGLRPRATCIVVAVWFGLFTLPILLFTPDMPATGIGWRQAVRDGLRTLIATLRKVAGQKRLLLFLVASALYRDGLTTLFAMGGIVAASLFGMKGGEILIFAIGLNVTAGLGAAVFAFLDDLWGSRPTVLTALAGLLAFGLPILVISDKWHFIWLALGLGIFVGPAQAASRTLMARLSPDGMEAEMFGLYALTGKAAAFLGPICFGLATEHLGGQRAGVASILCFLALGGILLSFVREPAHEA